MERRAPHPPCKFNTHLSPATLSKVWQGSCAQDPAQPSQPLQAAKWDWKWPAQQGGLPASSRLLEPVPILISSQPGSGEEVMSRQIILLAAAISEAETPGKGLPASWSSPFPPLKAGKWGERKPLFLRAPMPWATCLLGEKWVGEDLQEGEGKRLAWQEERGNSRMPLAESLQPSFRTTPLPPPPTGSGWDKVQEG